MRNHLDLVARNVVNVYHQFGGDLGHHDAVDTVGCQLSDQFSWLRFGLCHERVKGRDNRLFALLDKVQNSISPVAGIQSKFVLQADHVTQTLVDNQALLASV